MKKIIALLLICALVIAPLVACSSKSIEESKTSEVSTEEKSTKSTTEKADTDDTKRKEELDSNINQDGDFPAVHEPVEVSIAVIAGMPNTDQERLWFWKWAEEKTNIKVEPQQIELAAWPERQQLMFTTGQLPDAFMNCGFSNSALMRYGQVEESLIPLNDLIDNYAPNFKQVLEENPQVLANVTAPDGNIYSVPTLYTKANDATYRFFINAKWLEAVGMEMPRTLDEFYQVLKAFKEQDANENGDPTDEIPWGGSWSEGFSEKELIINALGFVTQGSYGHMVIDSKTDNAVFFPLHPAHKEMLSFMAKLWEEELLDQDMFTQTQVQYQSKAAMNLYGAAADGAPFVILPDAPYDFECTWALAENPEDTPVWPGPSASANGTFVITKNAENPAALIKWVDMFFTPLVSTMFWSGPEKDSEDDIGSIGFVYNEAGERIHTDFPSDITEGNEWEYLCKIISPVNGYPPGFIINEEDTEAIGWPYPESSKQEKKWRDEYEERAEPFFSAPYPAIFLTEEEQNLIDEIHMPIDDYIENMEAKFITGAESLENYDVFIEQLKALRAEEYEEILVQNYEAYLSNLE